MFRFAMIEASPRLAGIQKTALDDFDVDIAWHVTVATLPEAPLFIVGNELFDALPLRQYVRVAGGWRERMVGLAGDATLTFTAGPTLISSTAILPVAPDELPEGTIVETAPARTALMAEISSHIATRGGAGCSSTTVRAPGGRATPCSRSIGTPMSTCSRIRAKRT